jgi:hypothetical protein
MNRTIIFAHFDRDNIIDNYIITYLEELKKFCNNIIFVSDCNLLENEINKISHLITDFVAYKHNEYDFGSYKIGYQLLVAKHPQILEKTDELVFVNDSCYCIGSFEKVFNTEITKDIDAWGLTEGYNHSFSINSYYLQSYFISLRPAVFKERFFIDFINDITKLNNKDEIINKYEGGLSRLLLKNNKKLFAVFNNKLMNNYISENYIEIINQIKEIKEKYHIENQLLTYRIFNIAEANAIHSDKIFAFIEIGFPLLKRSVIQINLIKEHYLTFCWDIFLLKNHQQELIKIMKHCNRINAPIKKYQQLSTGIANIDNKTKFDYLFYGFVIFIYTIPYIGTKIFAKRRVKKFINKTLLHFGL